MKYLFTLFFLITVHLAHAQASLLLGGIRAATAIGTMAARNSKAKARQKVTMSMAPTPEGSATMAPASSNPFTYRGQPVARQRTEPGTLAGKGATEIMALETALEQSHQALLADSVQSFLPAAQLDIIRTVARQAAVARSDWNYAAYQHELAFYQREEARRAALAPAPAAESGQ